MDYIRPATLPAFLDPLLAALPDPMYNFAVTFLSHSIAIIMAIYDIASSLLGSERFNWDAQKILPPVITILAAYLALLSVYRTTAWAFRLVFWFIKWGGLFGLFMALLGWSLGSNNLSSVVNTGTMASIGALIWDVLNANRDEQRRPSRPNTRSQSRGQSGARTEERPSVFDSFDRHQEWQAGRNADARESAPDIVRDIMDIAEKYLGQGGLTGILENARERRRERENEKKDDH